MKNKVLTTQFNILFLLLKKNWRLERWNFASFFPLNSARLIITSHSCVEPNQRTTIFFKLSKKSLQKWLPVPNQISKLLITKFRLSTTFIDVLQAGFLSYSLPQSAVDYF